MLSKATLKDYTQCCTKINDRQRECIRLTAFLASGLSAIAARKHFGLEKLHERWEKFEKVIAETSEIREAFNEFAEVQTEGALAQRGIEIHDISFDD